jgi:hypothetical protein
MMLKPRLSFAFAATCLTAIAMTPVNAPAAGTYGSTAGDNSQRYDAIGVGAPKCDPESALRSHPRNKPQIPRGAHAQGMRADHRSWTPAKLPCKL